MFLKAGALSLILLLASRLLGLARESAQAAAFGASGLADAAVLILTLPDWITGMLASGAFAYVLLPAWAAQPVQAVQAVQQRLARAAVIAGVAAGALLFLFREPILRLLAPGLPVGSAAAARLGLLWSAVALPLALLASLWATRLQHEREYVGMYAANLVVNLVLIVTLAACSQAVSAPGAVLVLGVGLLVAMVARLAWLALRLRPFRPAPLAAASQPPALPAARVWAWAALAAGLPLALPFAARSAASSAGEGALVIFNYAWKLVELPLVLAIQLVATLAFAPIAAALASPPAMRSEASAAQAIRPAFALAWTLACAAVAGLVWAAPAVASLLFNWGRMDAASVRLVAEWGAVGAWSLLAQSLTAVAAVVLAAQGRMRWLVLAHAIALAMLLAAAGTMRLDPRSIMWLIDALLSLVALAAMLALGPGALRWLPWRALLAGAAVLLMAVGAASTGLVDAGGTVRQWVLGAGWALALVAVGFASSPDLRRALRR